MSEKTKSKLYLEELQSKFYTPIDQNNAEPSWVRNPEFLDKLKEAYPDIDVCGIIKEMEESQKGDLPTIYQNYDDYWILVRLFENIEESAEEISIKLPMRPLIGTLPSGKVNAMAVKVPEVDEYIVIFEDQIFTFANLIAKIVAQSIPFKTINEEILFSVDEEEVDNYLKNHPEASNRFNELIFAYVFYGQPAAAPQYFLDLTPASLAGILRDSLELFAVGHEYSHIFLGHMKESKRMMNIVESLEIDEIVFNWKNELQADYLGLRLMIGCMLKEGFDLSLSYVGADLFFGSLDIIEKSISIVRTGSVNNIINRTHPPTLQRREILRESLSILVNSESNKEAVETALHLAERIEYILKLHWNNIEPLLYKAYEDRKELDKRWLRFI